MNGALEGGKRLGARISERLRLPASTQEAGAAPSYDPVLLWAVLGLTSLGLLMVYSASAVTSAQEYGDALYFVKRQAAAALLGFGGMVVAMRYGYKRLELWAYPLLALTLVALLLVLVPGLGTTVKGAQRWIRLGFFNFQPAELSKFALVIYLARSLARKGEKVRTFSIGFVPHCIVTGFLMLLLLGQPDFGTSMMLLGLLFLMLFAAGAKISWLVGSVLLVVPFAIHQVMTASYRLKRIVAFMDPWADRLGKGWQLANSLMTLGSGGFAGQGLGAGKQKLFYLPEGHTDFIVSVIGEELGLLGILAVVALFAVLVWRGMRAAFNAADAFGCYLALGITSLLGIQAIINMLVAMGMLPTKGLTLPFVSYGGTSLVLCLSAAGVLLAISSGRGGYLRPQRSSRS